MDATEVVMIGAGAMGGILAAALARGGARLSIVDTDAAHVAAINQRGLCPLAFGEADAIAVPATTEPPRQGYADLVVVMTPAYECIAAARTASQILKPEGSAVSCQNGLGNAEALIDALGAGRVFMGSTRSSADRPAPGQPRATKIDPTTVGEFDGRPSDRTAWFARTATAGGLPTKVSENIQGVLWSKFLHNCAVNAISAITGLRQGETSRDPEIARLRWQILDEGLAVARAKGIALEHPDPKPQIAAHTWRKYTKPSMQQHIDQGRLTEIDAINGWLVREGDALGVPTPINRAVAALARGRARAAHQACNHDIDYAALTADAVADVESGAEPWKQLGYEE